MFKNILLSTTVGVREESLRTVFMSSGSWSSNSWLFQTLIVLCEYKNVVNHVYSLYTFFFQRAIGVQEESLQRIFTSHHHTIGLGKNWYLICVTHGLERATEKVILFVDSSIWFYAFGAQHNAWLIYILLLACTYICLGQLIVHSFILFADSSIWFYAFGAQHMIGLFIFYYLYLAHTWLAYLYFHNTCFAYLYFTFGVHIHMLRSLVHSFILFSDSYIYLVLRFWRTTHAWVIDILLFTFCFWRTHLGLFIFYFWRYLWGWQVK